MRIAITDNYSPSILLPDGVDFPHVVYGGGVLRLEYSSLDLDNEINSAGPGNDAGCVDNHLLHTPKKGNANCHVVGIPLYNANTFESNQSIC
jgi:hypothetical protein